MKLMWIPSHVGLVENELIDEQVRQAILVGSIFDRPLSSSDFQSLARHVFDESMAEKMRLCRYW
jgi:hypothetical protein